MVESGQLCYELEIAPSGDAAGDNRLPVLAAEVEALDGELMAPPRRVARERLSGPDEDKLGDLIKAEHEAGERSLKDAVRHFMKCGDFLLQAKAGLPHGGIRLLSGEHR